jgi:integrase
LLLGGKPPIARSRSGWNYIFAGAHDHGALALETGCRYSELARLEVHDFNPDAGTIAIRKSKGGKPRHVILTPEGADFFQYHGAGRTSTRRISWQRSGPIVLAPGASRGKSTL